MKNIQHKTIFLTLLINLSIYSFQPGIVGGLSVFKYDQEISTGGDWLHCDYKKGFVGGFLIEQNLLDFLSIQPAIVYSMRGTICDFDSTVLIKTVTINYIAFPCHFKFKYPKSFLLSPYIYSGINIGLLLSAKLKTETNINNHSTIQTENWSDAFYSTETGFDLGFGLDLKLSKLTPFIEFNRYFGLKSLDKPKKIQSGFEIKCGIKYCK
jgi:hypothetical protein